MNRPVLIINRHGLFLPTPSGLSRITNLNELAKKVGRKITAFVDPSLSYLENLTFPSSLTINDSVIADELKSKLPEEISHRTWAVETISNDHDQRQLQVFALETDFFREFMNILAEEKISIDSYSPLACAVADLTPSPKPHITIFVQNQIYFLVAKINGQVITKIVDQLTDLKSDLAEFIVTLESASQTKIEQLYGFADRDLANLGLSIEDLPINFDRLKPSCSIKSSAITKLGLVIGDQEKKISRPPNLGQLPKLLLFLALSVAALALVIWLRFGNSKPAPTPEPSPSPVVMMSPSPTPESLDPKTVTITVLNGTTTPGYAAEIADRLAVAGYTSATTGNSKEENYQTNTLITNHQLVQTALVALLEDLNLTTILDSSSSATATKSATIYLEVSKK